MFIATLVVVLAVMYCFIGVIFGFFAVAVVLFSSAEECFDFASGERIDVEGRRLAAAASVGVRTFATFPVAVWRESTRVIPVEERNGLRAPMGSQYH